MEFVSSSCRRKSEDYFLFRVKAKFLLSYMFLVPKLRSNACTLCLPWNMEMFKVVLRHV